MAKEVKNPRKPAIKKESKVKKSENITEQVIPTEPQEEIMEEQVVKTEENTEEVVVNSEKITEEQGVNTEENTEDVAINPEEIIEEFNNEAKKLDEIVTADKTSEEIKEILENKIEKADEIKEKLEKDIKKKESQIFGMGPTFSWNGSSDGWYY